MDATTSPLAADIAAEIAALRQAFDALNRNDIPAFIPLLAPQVERIEFAGSAQAGAFRGLAAVTEHLRTARATWAEGTCEPLRFIVAGDRIVVLVHVHVRLKHELTWRDGDTADVFTFANGKVIHWQTFINQQEALEWAGVKPSDAQ